MPPRGNVAADLHALFAPLHATRATCEDVVTFVEEESSEGSRIIDSASKFVCSLHSPVLKVTLAHSDAPIVIQPAFVPFWPAVVSFFYGVMSTATGFSQYIVLMQIGDYYDIPQLKEQCGAKLLSLQWTGPQAVTVLRDLPFDSFLRARSIALLQTRPLDLFHSDYWICLTRDFVVGFLSAKLNCSEKAIFDAALNWHVATQQSAGFSGSCASVGTDVCIQKTEAIDSHRPESSNAGAHAEPKRGMKRSQPHEAVEVHTLPPWLGCCIVYEHMSAPELAMCKVHLPLHEYVGYLEAVAGAAQAKRVRRRDRVEPNQDSQFRSYRCSRCGKDDVTAGVEQDCVKTHWRELCARTYREPVYCWDHGGKCPTCPRCSGPTEHTEETYYEHPCCGGLECSRGCDAQSHDWVPVWHRETL